MSNLVWSKDFTSFPPEVAFLALKTAPALDCRASPIDRVHFITKLHTMQGRAHHIAPSQLPATVLHASTCRLTVIVVSRWCGQRRSLGSHWFRMWADWSYRALLGRTVEKFGQTVEIVAKLADHARFATPPKRRIVERAGLD